MACLALKLRLAPCRETLGLPDTVLSAEDWKAVIASASDNTIDLASAYQWAGQLESSSMNGYGPWGIGVDGAARTPTDLMSYFNFGAGCSEVEVDLLSGEHTVIRTDISYDCGAFGWGTAVAGLVQHVSVAKSSVVPALFILLVLPVACLRRTRKPGLCV